MALLILGLYPRVMGLFWMTRKIPTLTLTSQIYLFISQQTPTSTVSFTFTHPATFLRCLRSCNGGNGTAVLPLVAKRRTGGFASESERRRADIRILFNLYGGNERGSFAFDQFRSENGAGNKLLVQGGEEPLKVFLVSCFVLVPSFDFLFLLFEWSNDIAEIVGWRLNMFMASDELIL